MNGNGLEQGPVRFESILRKRKRQQGLEWSGVEWSVRKLGSVASPPEAA
jgi:hypothetical protein